MPPEAFDNYFAALLAQFEALGLIGLGKLADPTVGEARPDLARARTAIEMLQMLEKKTQGNLSEGEAGELRRVLTGLRLNYIDQAGRPSAATDGASPPGEATGEAKEEDGGSESR
jgi:hypothetical protein